ncbi:hypothetical protein AVEN_204893-1, partial [Araneus ventricosus]
FLLRVTPTDKVLHVATFPTTISIPKIPFSVYLSTLNTPTPKPAVTGHATSILVGRISAGCCSERGRRQLGEW